jgi:hypothetical protein
MNNETSGNKTIHLSSGETKRNNVLYVRNVTGIAEERGYRLYWGVPGETTIVPALGLATSNPFRTEGAAIAYGERQGWGTATRMTERQIENPPQRGPKVYLGCTIDPKNREGLYYALTSQGRVMADTIEGIKSLIRDREKPQAKAQAR